MDKKQRIIITMLELVVKQGVHATPMSLVAKEANVAVGTIYHYFENKNQIIEEIYMMIVQDYGVVLMANLPENESYKKQCETMWLNLYNYFIGNPLAYKFIEFVAVPPLITKELITASIPHISNIREFILKGIKEKQLKDIPLKLILQMIFGNVISTVRLKMEDELEMNQEQMEFALEMSWNSLKYVD